MSRTTSLIFTSLLMAILVGSSLCCELCAQEALLADLAEAGRWNELQVRLGGKTDDGKTDGLEQQVNQAQADGMTVLHWAAFKNRSTIVRQLLESGAKVDARTIYDITALSIAAERGFADSVEVLVEFKADVEAKRLGSETPLMLAARNGDLRTVNSLIKAGAEVNEKEPKGQTALMWAAAAGNADAVDALVNADANIDERLKKTGFTAFLFAARNGHADVVSRLLQAGADINSTTKIAKTRGRDPRNKMSALMLAIESGHLELALQLVEAGADPNDQSSGMAPLHAIVWVRKTNVGDGISGDPPPRIAGETSTEDFVRQLVGAGADVNMSINSGKAGKAKLNPKGTTPFLLASSTADVPLMELLIELGADPTINNADNCTAFMAAAGVGVTAVGEEPGTEAEVCRALRLLAELGFDPNHVDENGETAMHGAAYRDFPLAAGLLAELGADPEVWNKRNRHGWTPRDIARGERPGSVKPSEEMLAAIDLLLAEVEE